MIKIPSIIKMISLTLVVMAGPAYAESLLTNGSFDDPSGVFNGWSAISVDPVGLPGWATHSAPVAVDMNGTGSSASGTLSQSFATWQGFDYFVTYHVSANHSGCPGGTKSLTISADGQSDTQTVQVSGGQQPAYREENFTFTADDSVATLTFQGDNTGSCGVILDTVSVIGPIIDIDALLHAPDQQADGQSRGTSPLWLNFPAGRFDLVPISAQFTAWTEWAGTLGWQNHYEIRSDQLGVLAVNDKTEFPTPQAALDDAETRQIELPDPGLVGFNITDPWSLDDNAGGISLLVLEVLDQDGDGVDDDVDNCPATLNPDQSDTDNDGIGDACEPDTDGDGFIDDNDNCPATANADQADNDGDGEGDACDADDDNDAVDDNVDNCPLTANEDQADFDGDGLGNVCDPDDDNDDVADADDNCGSTGRGDAVNGDGCSVWQICDCGGFNSHGGYVSCVAHLSNGFLREGLIDDEEKDAIMEEAGESACSKPKKQATRPGKGKGK